MQSQNKTPTEQLQLLMYQFNNNQNTPESLANFKKNAMALAVNGADLAARDEGSLGGTLLHHLVRTNKDGVNTNEIISLFAINKKNINKIKDFARITNKNGYSALQDLMYYFNHELCELNDFKQSAMLLAENGANLGDKDNTFSGCTLLHHLVCENENGVNTKEIIRLFEINNNNITKIENFANITNGSGEAPLQTLMYYFDNYLCTFNDFKISAMLLAKNNADLTVIGPIASKATVLHLLVLNSKDDLEDPEIKEILKLDDKLIDVRDGFGMTPLQALIRAKKKVPVPVENVEKLLQLKSDLHTTKTDNGETLLHSACVSGDLKVAQYLVTKGLELGAKTKLEGTMFHAASMNKKSELWQWLYGSVWQWLYDNNIDINAQNKEGKTALHLAVKMKNIAMVEWLIEKKVNLELKDNDQMTALDIAQENKLTKIADRLIGAGAKQNIVMNENDPFELTFDIPEDLKKIIENNSVTNYSGSSSNTKQEHVNEPQANNQPLPKENQTKTEPSDNMVHLMYTNSNDQNKDKKKKKIGKSSRVERLLDEPISQSDNNELTSQPSGNNKPHDNEQSEQSEETIIFLLDSILKTPAESDENRHIIDACEKIHAEGKQLMYEIISDSNDADVIRNPDNCLEIKELKKSLKLALKVLQPGVDENAINELKDHAKSLDGKPSFWKKFIGALLTLAGAVAIGLGISTVVPSGGSSIAACVGGGVLMAAGARLFYSGRHKGISRGMSDLAEAVANFTPGNR